MIADVLAERTEDEVAMNQTSIKAQKPAINEALRISVAMCTYNGGRYLREQLESIRLQELPVFELVVCDDRSTDDTLEILEEFAAQAMFPVRIVVNERQLGSSDNFGKAISLCTGDLIALSDQDDVWFPNKTRELTATLRNDPDAGGVFTNAVLYDERSQQTGHTLWESFQFSLAEQNQMLVGDFAPVLLRRPIVTGATLIFRRSLVEDILPIPPNWIHDDWIAWKIALQSQLTLTTAPVMAYRTHTAQQIGVPRGAAARFKNIFTVYRKGTVSGTKKRLLKEYENGAKVLRLLAAETDHSPKEASALRENILLKAEFCEGAFLSLHHSISYRIRFAFGNLANYQRFRFLGWHALLRDLFV